MTSPEIVLDPAVMLRPLTPKPAEAPLNTMIGVPAYPGCVVPSMVTGSVIVGSGDVTAIVFEPEPIEKWIVSVPGFALAALIASRSVELAALQTPSSVSAAELSVDVAAQNVAHTINKNLHPPIGRCPCRVQGKTASRRPHLLLRRCLAERTAP